MSSLISGYNYDIFISYRQKDNKGDGWVSEFVEALKTELESTFKEEISVYFDINPHDGLLETHDVDESLKEKLKCLIFIPIISRTYCDPKAFAWEQEFKAFIEQASKDEFGLKVRLPNGNVSSRVLPIVIYDLDNQDVKLCESVLGSVLRGIEFIYKEPGVNRPLKPDDDERINLNKTKYRNQINKVGNAIKEIIAAFYNLGRKEEKNENVHPKTLSVGKLKNNKRYAVGYLFVLLLIVALGLFYIRNHSRSNEVDIRSIAVLPFSDFSSNNDQEYFANGMMEEILNQLAKINELQVISRTSSMIYKDSDLPIKTIADQLNVSNVVEGSVQKAGERIRITVQLIEGKSEKHLWSESYDRELSDVFSIQTEIAMNIARELRALLTTQEEDLIREVPTNNTLAYDYYLRGLQYSSMIKEDSALFMFSKAIDEDPEFVMAYVQRGQLYSNIYFTKNEYNIVENWTDFNLLAKTDLQKALQLNPELPAVKLLQARIIYNLDRDNEGSLRILNDILSQSSNYGIQLMGYVLRRKGLWEEHLNYMHEAMLRGPFDAVLYIETGLSNMLLRRYSEAMDLFNKPQQLGMNLGIGTELKLAKFSTMLLWEGNIEEALRISELNDTELGIGDYVGNSYYYYSRDFDNILETADIIESQFKYYPKTLVLAQVYYFMGNSQLSKQYADSAISVLESKINESPSDERFYAALGYAYGYAGENMKAVENGQKAVELKPMSVDVLQAFEQEKALAEIYIITGSYDMAMDKIEYLLTIPGGLSVPMLKIDPAYDKLRDLERFQTILGTVYTTQNN